MLQDQEDEGVSRVRVTSRRSPHKVECVSGLVARSRVDMPKVSGGKKKKEAKQSFPGVPLTQLHECNSSIAECLSLFIKVDHLALCVKR